jgi:hypothetical protein
MKSKLQRLKLGAEVEESSSHWSGGGKKAWKNAVQASQAVAERASRSIESALSHLKGPGSAFRDYLESEQFERDLDELALRLGIDGRSYPAALTNQWIRVCAKARYIMLKSRDQVLSGGASLNPKVLLVLTAAFAGVKSFQNRS